MEIKYFVLIGFLISAKILNAQDNKNSDHDHHKNEIGIANSSVFFINEEEIAYGLHFHYIRNIHDTKFGIGIGYERIFDEHKHNSIGIVGSYNPVERIIFNLSPGISFEDGTKPDVNFSFHIETAYDFEIRNFHFGPVLELAYDQENYHISLGLHIGLGF